MDLCGRLEDLFCNLAIKKGDGSRSDDSQIFEDMKEAFIGLYNLPTGKERIIKLLTNDNEWVRFWVAAQLLSEGKNKAAIRVLQDLSNKGGVLGFSAEMVLSEYKSGSLGPPFGIMP